MKRAGALLVFAWTAAGVHADAPRASVLDAVAAAELRSAREALGASDAATRARGFATLSALPEDTLPAIAARAESLRASLRGSELASALAQFRGAQAAEINVPTLALEKGVLARLEVSRSRSELAAAEWVGLVRGLSAQHSPEAAEVVVSQLLAVDKNVAASEGPALLERLGAVAVPALIRCRSTGRTFLRPLCTNALASQGNEAPGRAVQQDDAHLLAVILNTYGEVLAFDAMPVVVAYLVDERAEVRAAALSAVRRFGRNAIWQLRERYLGVAGRDAPAEWSHERVLAEILREHGSAHLDAYKSALAAAHAAEARGDVGAAFDALTPALALDVNDEQALELATLSLALADRALAAGDVTRARALLARAARLDPDGVDASRVRARSTFLVAEELAARGVLDLGRYEQAVALDRDFTLATQALAELNGEARAHEAWVRRVIAGVAGLLLALAAGFWLRARLLAGRADGEQPAQSEPADLPA